MNELSLRSGKAWGAFTVVEVLIAAAVLAFMAVCITQLFSGTSSLIMLGNKRMDADAEARAVLDRMAIDFGRMIRRADVDYCVKSPSVPMTAASDQIAFYAEVPGYYPATGSQSPVSLVGFRMNTGRMCLERLGKGLLWSGVTSGTSPMVFLPLTIQGTWPAATGPASDPDYELFGPDIFRVEYGYLLKGQILPDGTVLPSAYSATPWDERVGIAHSAIDGFRDVSGMVVSLAVIDPKSRALVSGSALNVLAARMTDFDPARNPGDMENQWRAAIDSSGLPKAATAAMRVYQRVFPIAR